MQSGRHVCPTCAYPTTSLRLHPWATQAVGHHCHSRRAAINLSKKPTAKATTSATQEQNNHTHTLTSATKTVGEAVGVGCWAPFRCAGVWLRLCLANISFVSCVLFILLRSHRTRNGENWADFEERTIKLKYIQAQRIKDRYITYSPNKVELLRHNSIKTMWEHLGSSIQSKLPMSSFSRIWSNFPLVHSSLI